MTRHRETSSAKAKSSEPVVPPPKRQVPFFLLQAHEVRVGNELDTDWTLSWDWREEQRLREERNQLIKAQLKEGKTVAYRSSGWSLFPKVHSNDLTSYLPVRWDEQVEESDIVFCEVQPTGYFYSHNVHKKEWDHKSCRWKYWISNLKDPPRINGYCYLENIHGKLFQVLH